MENNKLVSMTEKVLETYQRLCNGEITEEEALMIPVRYAKFLSQPLTLGMFIPVGENGDVLNTPDPISIGRCLQKKYKVYEAIYDENETEYYSKAEENILFKGFCVLYTELDNDNIPMVITNNNKEYPFHFTEGEWKIGIGKKIIEDLNKGIILTETALKQIYG